MNKLATAIAVGLMLGAGMMVAPSLYAQGDQAPSVQRSDQGMMPDGMIGGGMGGMMGMMRQMSQMMDHCNKMMGDSDGGRPNENWRKDAPETPEKKG